MSRFEDFTLDEAIAIAKRNDPGENVPSVSRVLLARIAELERQLAVVKEDARLVYAAIPDLPITTETADAATDALHQFCLAFNDFIVERGEKADYGAVPTIDSIADK